MKKPGIFDEAINAIMLAASATWTDAEIGVMVKHKPENDLEKLGAELRDAARVLRAAQGLGEIFRHEIIGHYIVANGTGMNQLFRAILSARRRAERDERKGK